MSNGNHSDTLSELAIQIEALLFVAPGSVTPSQLAVALETSIREVELGLGVLETFYKRRGLRLQRHAGRVQLTTAPELAPLVENFLGLEITSRLSRAAIETLAIIAYNQPATRPQVDAIRGVNSDSSLKSLLSKGLIQEIGRAGTPGRPILYSTTSEFLQYFGLNSLSDLPPINLDEEVQKMPNQNLSQAEKKS